MRISLFGTYDVAAHPRVGVLAEGLRGAGLEVQECNVPLGLDTAARVAMLRQPWRLASAGGRLGGCWRQLAARARRQPRPDAVVVGHLGHADVHLARRLFPGVPVVLDYMVSVAGTAADRALGGRALRAGLGRLDAAALGAADVVVVDTQEHRDALPPRFRARGVVVPVGAPDAWYAADPGPGAGDLGAALGDTAAEHAGPDQTEPDGSGSDHAGSDRAGSHRPRPESTDGGGGALRVVFFGLFTPLQGAVVIAEAARWLPPSVRLTMVGRGQDEAAARAAAADAPGMRWVEWVPAPELPTVVAAHDVCLGIFGTGPKALRVVPNKVFQGAAAGRAVVTSDTAPQRRAFDGAALFVPPGDARALADALAGLAADRAELERWQGLARERARRFRPERAVQPLVERLKEVCG